MKPLFVLAKIRADRELDDLKKYGFNWLKYDDDNGVHWTKGDITIFSSNRELKYKKLTQDVLNDILALACAGMLILIQE